MTIKNKLRLVAAVIGLVAGGVFYTTLLAALLGLLIAWLVLEAIIVLFIPSINVKHNVARILAARKDDEIIISPWTERRWRYYDGEYRRVLKGEPVEVHIANHSPHTANFVECDLVLVRTG